MYYIFTLSQQQYSRNCMSGEGVDRHLFCLYIVSQGLGIDSPFLNETLSQPWKLSTSQQPQSQTNRWDSWKGDHIWCPGGGFGPVSDDGYGVSYMIAGEDRIFFHVSSKKHAIETDSKEFSMAIHQALRDMKSLFD